MDTRWLGFALICISLPQPSLAWLGSRTQPDGMSWGTSNTFVRNGGSETSDDQFFSSAGGVQVQLTAAAMTLMTVDGNLIFRFVRSNKAVRLDPEEQTMERSAYFVGSDPSCWRVNVSHYRKIRYRGLYSGIDLVVHMTDGGMEFDIEVSPEANLSDLRLAVDGGAGALRLEGSTVVIPVGNGVLRQRLGSVFAIDGQGRVLAAEATVALRKNTIAFRSAKQPPGYRLIIDPILEYSTYLGGTDEDRIAAMTVDSGGEVYVTGTTSSTDLPLVDPYQSSPPSGQQVAFVLKLDATGTRIVFSTYLGSGLDSGRAIAIDASHNVYVAGSTDSAAFPILNAFQAAYAGRTDGFVTKIAADGMSLLYSTYLGGSLGFPGDTSPGGEQPRRIAVDTLGNAIVVGSTNSTDFPTTAGALQRVYGGGATPDPGDGFVSRFAPDGSLAYSTFLGGSKADDIFAVDVDSAGAAIVGGRTSSLDFPVVGAAPWPYGGGTYDGFVAKLTPGGDAMVFSTYFGGSDWDEIAGVALDSTESICAVGTTRSTDLPLKAPIVSSYGGVQDLFVARLKADGSVLERSTYLGGSDSDVGRDVAVDLEGNVWLVGQTASDDYPLAAALQVVNRHGFGGDFLVTTLDPTMSRLLFSSYLGGTGWESPSQMIGIDGSGAAYIAGWSRSTDFPTVNALQAALAGGGVFGDGVIAKIGCLRTAVPEALDRAVCVGATVTLDASPSSGCSAYLYRWLAGATEVCGWSATPTCTASPPTSTTYTLEVACTDKPSCVGSKKVDVEVLPDLLPSDLMNSVRSVRAAGEVVMTWGADPVAAAYSGYRGTSKGVWPLSATFPGLRATALTVADVSPPPPLYFYRVVGVSCSGREGP